MAHALVVESAGGSQQNVERHVVDTYNNPINGENYQHIINPQNNINNDQISSLSVHNFSDELATILKTTELYDLFAVLNDKQLNLNLLKHLKPEETDKLCAELNLSVLQTLQFRQLMEIINDSKTNQNNNHDIEQKHNEVIEIQTQPSKIINNIPSINMDNYNDHKNKPKPKKTSKKKYFLTGPELDLPGNVSIPTCLDVESTSPVSANARKIIDNQEYKILRAFPPYDEVTVGEDIYSISFVDFCNIFCTLITVAGLIILGWLCFPFLLYVANFCEAYRVHYKDVETLYSADEFINSLETYRPKLIMYLQSADKQFTAQKEFKYDVCENSGDLLDVKFNEKKLIRIQCDVNVLFAGERTKNAYIQQRNKFIKQNLIQDQPLFYILCMKSFKERVDNIVPTFIVTNDINNVYIKLLINPITYWIFTILGFGCIYCSLLRSITEKRKLTKKLGLHIWNIN